MHLPKMELEILGPAAIHNHPCCVCREKLSVLDLSRGVMEPCWSCQELGYQVTRSNPGFIGRLWKRSRYRK